MLSISPQASDPRIGRLDLRSYPNGRKAFKAVLAAIMIHPDDHVLLPAYIGWSSREGSGVFDPVAELGVGYDFYRVDCRLRIDADDLLKTALNEQIRVVLLVHWFGFVDPQAPAIVAKLRSMGKWVIEDCAHALFSDRIGGICGHLGHASFYSLHKVLPISTGGVLRINDDRLAGRIQLISEQKDYIPTLAEYDLRAIAHQRRENTDRLAELLAPYKTIFEPIYPWPLIGVIPQTWPILIRGLNRDDFYFGMNERGFGVVSLYHTQIDQIDNARFPNARWVASRICNLPVHQDIDANSLTAMVEELKRTADIK